MYFAYYDQKDGRSSQFDSERSGDASQREKEGFYDKIKMSATTLPKKDKSDKDRSEKSEKKKDISYRADAKRRNRKESSMK
jgi:hypothetical protein